VSSELILEIHQIHSDEERRRLSGPGLRTFVVISGRLGLKASQRIAVLGAPSASTYYRWIRKAQRKEELTLSVDTLMRVSAFLGIYKAMVTLFPIESEALTWLHGPHKNLLFAGRSPLDLMQDSGFEGIKSVRTYLDAWSSGSI